MVFADTASWERSHKRAFEVGFTSGWSGENYTWVMMLAIRITHRSA